MIRASMHVKSKSELMNADVLLHDNPTDNGRPTKMASTEDSIALQELEPSPTEETPAQVKDGYFPDQSDANPPSSERKGTNALGLSQHSVGKMIEYHGEARTDAPRSLG